MRAIVRKKIKLIAINPKVLFCRKQDLIVNGVKGAHSFNYAKKIPCLLLYSFQWKERLFKSRKSLFFFFSVARTILKVIPNGNEWNLKAGISSEENLFLNRYFMLFSFSFQSHLPSWTNLIPTILLSQKMSKLVIERIFEK